MRVCRAWAEAWPGQSLEACRGAFRGNGKGLVSQEEGGGCQEILQIQNGWGAPRGRGTGAKADGAPESICGDELRSCPAGRCFSTCALGSPGSLRKHAGEVHKKSRELALIAFISQSEVSDRRWASWRSSQELSGHILQASQACTTRLCYLPGLPAGNRVQ